MGGWYRSMKWKYKRINKVSPVMIASYELRRIPFIPEPPPNKIHKGKDKTDDKGQVLKSLK